MGRLCLLMNGEEGVRAKGTWAPPPQTESTHWRMQVRQALALEGTCLSQCLSHATFS